MTKQQQLFFLATLDSLEVTLAANVKALRSLISFSQNDAEVIPEARKRETIKEIEDEFEKSIFSRDVIGENE